MERAFDKETKTTYIKIYKLSLPKGKNKIIKKESIVDLNNIKSHLAPAFTIIDNFEGLALGPHLPNGNKVLFLVSDNNFRDEQKTVLLALEVPEELLK